jgi:hypothetical protein
VSRSWFSRIGRATVTAIATVALISPFVNVSPAQAAVGRPNNAEAEIRAYYDEFLGRPADSGGYTQYINRVYEDCRHGILASGMMIGDAAEAHGRWPSPEAFTRAMYRALLNRDADPGGYNTYVNVIRHRGYRWAITDIQASGEFHNRLGAMCNGRRGIGNQNVVKPQLANDLAIDISNAGFTLVAACGVNQVMQMVGMGKLKKTYQATEAIKSAKFALKNFVGKSNECKAAFKVLTIADKMIRLADTGGGAHNPVYMLENTRTDWRWNGKFCITKLGAGPSAADREVIEVTYRCS